MTQGDMPRLTEAKADENGEYEDVWRCAPPAEGVPFRVVRSEWNADMTVRTILEVELG